MDYKKLLLSAVVASSTTALAFFAYKTYKTYKEYKQYEEETISGEDLNTLLEAKRIGEENDRRRKELEEEDFDVFMEPVYDPMEDELAYIQNEEEYISTSEPVSLENLRENMEAKELKFPPNSREALEQFINLSLANIGPATDKKSSELRAIMEMLFMHRFIPQSLDDRHLKGSLIQNRQDFFGEGRWLEWVSIAEVMLFFAELAQYDLDYPLRRSLNNYIYNLGIYRGIGQFSLESIIENLTSHVLQTNEGLYTMFGIPDEQMQEMYRQAEQNKKDDRSFMQEYNTWLYYTGGEDLEAFI